LGFNRWTGSGEHKHGIHEKVTSGLISAKELGKRCSPKLRSDWAGDTEQRAGAGQGALW
jgi:hypothetical protein